MFKITFLGILFHSGTEFYLEGFFFFLMMWEFGKKKGKEIK